MNLTLEAIAVTGRQRDAAQKYESERKHQTVRRRSERELSLPRYL